jgi:uncharacterized protein YgiM (DUF1202 family)
MKVHNKGIDGGKTMVNKRKKIMFALLMAVSVSLLASGCDKLKKEPETEAPTEKVTEAPTEKETEAPTEKETEPPTEPETEAPTEAETEPKVLTAAEEKEQQTEFDQIHTMYAMDDINVRTEPSTGDDSEIFSSFYQGDRVNVIGETPNWCLVDLEDYETNGYVSKQYLSETAVDPKTDEERQESIEQELSGTVTSSDGTSDGSSTAASTDTSAVDLEYNVSSYAESFLVYAMTGANLRSTPAQDGDIVQTVASGTSVTAIGETDRWYKVEVNGTVGFVNKNLFSTEPAE